MDVIYVIYYVKDILYVMAVIDIHSVMDIRYRYTIRKDHSVEVIYSNRFYTYWISITYKRKEKEIKKKKNTLLTMTFRPSNMIPFSLRENFFIFF